MQLDLNPQFQRAIDMMANTDKCLFITGRAGTGKSTLLNHFCSQSEKHPVVLAPTGVAALNVKGQTIHRFFNFYIDITPQKIREKKVKPKDPDLYKPLKTLIIDEASMLRADLLDCIDEFLRIYGPKLGQPFGGVQMVFVGDLYQLPPVVTAPEKEVFTTHYKTPYFFSAHAFRTIELEVIELEKIYRQKDQDFIDLLNQIRNNSVDDTDIDKLNTRYLPDAEPEPDVYTINLTTTNKRADEINDLHLQQLSGTLHEASAVVDGEFGREYYPTATELQFKQGAQIMMLNNDSRKRWVNGSIGVIEAIKKNVEGDEYVRVRLQDNDEVVFVNPFKWEVFQFHYNGTDIVSEAAGTFTQFPFRLAWAITIHKSQGKTFDHVCIDLGRGTFVSGQMYVALSRCTSFEGVVLKTAIKKHHIQTDSRIFEFLTKPPSIDTTQIAAKIREVIDAGGKLDITYLKADDTQTQHIVIPIKVGMSRNQGNPYLGMKAYCTALNREIMFQVDRILNISTDVAK